MKSITRIVILISLVSVLIFTTCDNPMGMGDPIDWESPVLTLDPVPNPLYVRIGTKPLTGTVTDNVGVDRILFLNTATGEELFKVKRNGDRFEIDLLFTEEQNNQKIIAQIIAYDKAGNCKDAIAFVTLIIDMRPPVVDDIWIQRTDTRIADLESFGDLKELENEDPKGEKKEYLFKYQNGWFYVNGVVSDEETRVADDIRLNIYDSREIDTVLLSLKKDDDCTPYYPRWTVKEEDIIEAGTAKLSGDYKDDYYKNGERYYYRVVIIAKDMSENSTDEEEIDEEEIIEEDKGFICLWAESDKPKGLLDPIVGITDPIIVSRGEPLPVDFFDDDSLLWAYTGLLTEEQWNGTKPVYNDGSGDISIPTENDTDDKKLEWLKGHLTGTVGDSAAIGTGKPLYNWKYDKHSGLGDAKELIEDQIKGKSLDEHLVYVPTGNLESDYGAYVLFAIAADKKLSPHNGNGPEWTNKNIWTRNYWHISVVDENVPLIVFDTQGNPADNIAGCPEENTFPILNDGEYFTIRGYTLRENASKTKEVETFRMAWIPYYIPGGADSKISDVQKALSDPDYDKSNSIFNTNSGLAGIQHWEFKEGGGPGTGHGKFDIDDDQYPLDGGSSVFMKQDFEKTFSVMGGDDDIKNNYKNFTYDGERENETKLFVFYAKDNTGHDVFRQLRLLGSKTPPKLTVYDISNKLTDTDLGGLPPDPNLVEYVDTATGGGTEKYYKDLNIYNNSKYAILKGKSAGLGENDEAIAFQIYPRGTIVKYWIKASEEGQIAIKDITMKDITFSGTEAIVGSDYNIGDKSYSFLEYYPDVTQRTFLIEASDKLGNVARLQRTIAVTNAARLVNITTTTQAGTYGIDTVITLQANFSGQIYVTGGTPYLNVRYKENGAYKYKEIPCKNTPGSSSDSSLALEFDFIVEEGYGGELETLFDDSFISPNPNPFNPPDNNKRPIILEGATKIIDALREDSAFVPGYQSESAVMPNWTSVKNSLQEKKVIKLDGTRPVITSVTAGGKNAWAANEYYFKAGETIEFKLSTGSTGRAIRASDSQPPGLQYYIKDSTNTNRGPYNTAFTYLRPDGQNTLVFGLPVNIANCPYDGELINVTLFTPAGVIDSVDNSVSSNALATPIQKIYIKQTKPSVPDAALGGNTFGTTPNTPIYFNTHPTLDITPSTAPFAEWEKPQYSTNGGLKWDDYASTYTINNNGTYRVQARYLDRAENEAPIRDQLIQVNTGFPKLAAVSAVQSNGWYTAGKNLTFNLSFEDKVSVGTGAVSITLKNAGASTTDEITLSAVVETEVTTVKFEWLSISGKEMRDGLYISDVDLSGLKDIFGNTGGTGTGNYSATASDNIITITPVSGAADSYPCINLPYRGIKVDAVTPTVIGRTPGHQGVSGGDVDAITLTFSEPVWKGSGTIIVRPRAEYAIPPVFEDEGYYLGTDGTRYNVPPTGTIKDRTYIPSFFDVYNNTALTTADRAYLTQGSSVSDLTLNTRTGQSAGPYKKTTQGLIEGRGYTGNQAASPAVNTDSPYMIPDTSTKWVLDYQFSIIDTTAGSAVTNIRNALTKAKFRWQEIEVVSTDADGTGNIVTIPLNEPLLKGLQWDVYYPLGTFTDEAGNQVAASGYNAGGVIQANNTDYYFTSAGVQAPVIRVNRRSYDGRNNNWASNAYRTYQAPPNTAGWDINTTDFDHTGAANDPGWGITDFNTVHYRVESESSVAGATTAVEIYRGDTGDHGAAIGAWTGTVADANPGVTAVNNTNWTAAAANNTNNTTGGTWILPNIIRRSATAANQTYTVTTKNGTSESRTPRPTFAGFRSYNRDLTKAQLDGTATGTDAVTLISPGAAQYTNGQGIFTFNNLEASKSYVIATTTASDGVTAAKGYEGVFRTVIAFRYDANRGASNYIAIEGSNVKNGMPSIAGFPVRDAEETGDNRFIKVFYRDAENLTDGGNTGNRKSYYWVSTEIVCEWYFLSWGGTDNGTHQSCGEVDNYQTVGYGDLTYGFNVTRY